MTALKEKLAAYYPYPNNWTDRPHVLIVREVGDDEWTFADYEIQHWDDCPMLENATLDGASYMEYTCGVGWQETQVETRWSLKYSGCPIDRPGQYLIASWFDTIRGFDYTEYDGGMGVLEYECMELDESRNSTTYIVKR